MEVIILDIYTPYDFVLLINQQLLKINESGINKNLNNEFKVLCGIEQANNAPALC